MNTAKDIFKTHPSKPTDIDMDAMIACIEACHECEVSCNACADACLAESQVQSLLACIRMNLDCGDACSAAARMLGRQTQTNWSVVSSQIESMALACRICAEECERHAGKHEHCRICAEVCRRCEDACQHLLQAAPAQV